MSRFSTAVVVAGVWMAGAGFVQAADDPFHEQLQLSFGPGILEGCSAMTTVPAGKRLVVEYISAQLTPPSPQKPWLQQLRTTVGGETVFHSLDTQPIGYKNNFLTAQSLKLYGEAGTTVDFCAHRTASGGFMSGLISISGVLVDVP